MRTRRLERCERCEQPRPVCVCDLVRPIATHTPLFLLVHHIEAHKTTSTSRLAALSLGAPLVLWGERGVEAPILPDGPLLLLFPSDDAVPLTPALAEGATLIVPDGTWPQARKIARRVRATGERVTCVRLGETRASRYSLRHTTRIDALSTLEAIAHALGVIEGPEIESAILALFDAFVARHAPFGAGLSR